MNRLKPSNFLLGALVSIVSVGMSLAIVTSAHADSRPACTCPEGFGTPSGGGPLDTMWTTIIVGCEGGGSCGGVCKNRTYTRTDINANWMLSTENTQPCVSATENSVDCTCPPPEPASSHGDNDATLSRVGDGNNNDAPKWKDYGNIPGKDIADNPGTPTCGISGVNTFADSCDSSKCRILTKSGATAQSDVECTGEANYDY